MKCSILGCILVSGNDHACRMMSWMPLSAAVNGLLSSGTLQSRKTFRAGCQEDCGTGIAETA